MVIENTAYIKALGNHLCTLKEELNVNQEMLAYNANLSKRQVFRIDRGITNPTVCTLLIIAQTLKIEPKVLPGFPFKEEPKRF